MPKVISEEIVEIDGQKYKVTTYSNGAVVKSIYSDEPYIPQPEPLSETDEAIYSTQANVEYLVALKELDL